MANAARKSYVDDYADAAEQLLKAGDHHPTVIFIAREYCGKQLISHKVIDDFQDSLPRIRQRLESRGHQCALVSREHYSRPPPDTEADAYEHLALGSRPAIGIYFSQGEDDLILTAALHKGLISAAGRNRSSLQRVIVGSTSGHIDLARAAEALKEFDQLSLPDNNSNELERLRSHQPVITGPEDVDRE